MNREYQLLVTDEPVEFEIPIILHKYVEYTSRLINQNWKITTWNQLDLETLGS
jgi:hypothetical protein